MKINSISIMNFKKSDLTQLPSSSNAVSSNFSGGTSVTEEIKPLETGITKIETPSENIDSKTSGLSRKDKRILSAGAGIILAGMGVLFYRTSAERLQNLFKHEKPFSDLRTKTDLFEGLKFESLKDDKNVLSLDELSGLEKIKSFIEKREILLKNRASIDEHKIKSFSSILLWGVPGTGKTAAAMGIAKKIDADFIRLDKEIFDSEFVSRGPRQLAECFRSIRDQALENPEKNYVVFMDEIDSTMSIDRGSVAKHDDILVNTLKQCMTDIQRDCDNILFIGSTNKDPSGFKSDNVHVQLNPAILSRFNYRFEIGMPQPCCIEDAWIKLSQTKSGKNKYSPSQSKEIAKAFYNLKMSYRDITDVSNKLNIEDALEYCNKKTYNSVDNLLKVLRADEKLGFDPVKHVDMDKAEKENIISDLEKALKAA